MTKKVIPSMAHLAGTVAKKEEEAGVPTAWKPKRIFRGRAFIVYQIAVLKRLGVYDSRKQAKSALLSAYLSTDKIDTMEETALLSRLPNGSYQLTVKGKEYLDSFLTNPALGTKLSLCVEKMLTGMETGKFDGAGCSPYLPPCLTFIRVTVNG